MGKLDKIFKRAIRSPGNLRFKDLCFLAESVGFQFRGQSGSHRIYKHPDNGVMLNFQQDKNMAKRYQIKQLIAVIRQYNLMKD